MSKFSALPLVSLFLSKKLNTTEHDTSHYPNHKTELSKNLMSVQYNHHPQVSNIVNHATVATIPVGINVATANNQAVKACQSHQTGTAYIKENVDRPTCSR
jgi:hypothetical protein